MRRPVISAPERDISSDDVAKVLSAATSPALRCWLSLMAFQGFRSAEVSALRKEGIDLQERPPSLRIYRDAAPSNKTALLHDEVLNSLRALGCDGRGLLFPDEDAASISRKVGRHFKACSVHGNATSLLMWYRAQVKDRGQNFDRQLSGNSDPLTQIERQLVIALDRQVPGVSHCYQQAIVDLDEPNRISFRGVATELRELVREVLDRLAPDGEVMGKVGFKLESGLAKPSQKQKTRFILKALGVSESARDAPETAASLVEELVASFCRSLYVRSSNSLHADADRKEVRQIKMYVDAVTY